MPAAARSVAVAAAILLVAGALSNVSGADAVRTFSCPNSPNCVSSDAQGTHGIPPLRIRGASEAAWQALEKRLNAAERVKIAASEPGYLRAEFTTRLLRFTDDVEFELRPDQGIIAVRSASRVGYYDFGANRSRIEKLREELRADGVVA
jgi:uncharacterized protein (DUF1499 family)